MKISSILTIMLCLFSFSSFSGNGNKLIQSYLEELSQRTELTASDVSNWLITDSHVDKRNGIEFVYIAQSLNGIKVQNGTANFAIKNGEVQHFSDRLIRNISARANGPSPSLEAGSAISMAALDLGISVPHNLQLMREESETRFIFSDGGISLEPITAELLYLETDGKIRLAWNVSIYELSAENWWSVFVDAEKGEILRKDNWVNHCDHDEFEPSEHADNSGTSGPASNSVLTGAQYTVIALPAESPNHGPHILVQDPSDTLSSPFGWHDVNGAPGAEHFNTRGNNVYAYQDSLNNNQPGYSPSSIALHFNYPYNPADPPHVYKDAAITNLFYMNNIMHDVFYRYGFDEASGNFQTNNYGNGGAGNDEVRAEAQDGGGTNNANFATPPDGSRPRMQMYIWTNATADLTVNSPGTIAGSYSAVEAGFGPGIGSPITSDLVLVDDATLPNPNDACEPIANGGALSGKIAVIDRGDCTFVSKIQNAQNSGAIAVIMVNNVGGGAITMGGSSSTITIPSVMISLTDGTLIKNAMASGTVNVTLNPASNNGIDGDFDNGIVAHEYGHGISNRLTGGPSNSGCLQNAEQMGEGWSDWFGLILTIEAGDQGADVRGIGTFALDEPTIGGGIRPAPYSTDFNVNNFTFGATNNASISQPHGLGFVYCTALWDLTWALINQYGGVPDPDVYNGTGGNNIAMDLIMTSMKLQPCSPGMLDGRDAILAADQLLFGGVHRCLIWNVFANRGFGYSASQGSSSSRFDQVEAFDIPPFCQTATVAPTANFTYNPLAPECELNISFSDSSINTPQRWVWDFGDGTTDTMPNPTHAYAAPGTYLVKMRVSNTIGADSIIKTVNVTAPAGPAVNDREICSGLTAVLVASNPVGATEWFDSANNLVFTGPVLIVNNVTSDKVYYVRNNPSGGSSLCVSDYDTVHITVLESDFSFNVSQQTVSFTDLSSGATSWFWEFDDGNTSTQQNPVHTYSSSGTYNVKLSINNSPCSKIYAVSVVSGLDDANINSDIRIYPNPAREALNLEFKTAVSDNTRIEITDINGRTVLRDKMQSGDNSISLDVKDLSESVYIIHIENSQISETRRFIIVK